MLFIWCFIAPLWLLSWHWAIASRWSYCKIHSRHQFNNNMTQHCSPSFIFLIQGLKKAGKTVCRWVIQGMQRACLKLHIQYACVPAMFSSVRLWKHIFPSWVLSHLVTHNSLFFPLHVIAATCISTVPFHFEMQSGVRACNSRKSIHGNNSPLTLQFRCNNFQELTNQSSKAPIKVCLWRRGLKSWVKMCRIKWVHEK